MKRVKKWKNRQIWVHRGPIIMHALLFHFCRNFLPSIVGPLSIMVMAIFGIVKVWLTAHTFNQLFNFIWRDREYRRHDVLSSWINGISQSQTSFSGNSQSLTSFCGNSSPESHPFWRKEQTCLFYPIVASVGFSCRTLQRMHVRGLVHSYTFLFDPSIASGWRTSIAPFWTDMCCRLKVTQGYRRTGSKGCSKTKGRGVISWASATSPKLAGWRHMSGTKIPGLTLSIPSYVTLGNWSLLPVSMAI